MANPCHGSSGPRRVAEGQAGDGAAATRGRSPRRGGIPPRRAAPADRRRTRRSRGPRDDPCGGACLGAPCARHRSQCGRRRPGHARTARIARHGRLSARLPRVGRARHLPRTAGRGCRARRQLVERHHRGAIPWSSGGEHRRAPARAYPRRQRPRCAGRGGSGRCRPGTRYRSGLPRGSLPDVAIRRRGRGTPHRRCIVGQPVDARLLVKEVAG